MQRSLSGIKPTGIPHIGNYFGMIRPAIELQKNYETYYFVADLHALTTVDKAEQLHEDSYQVAAVFLALGLDPKHGAFFRQSDIPEVTELTWLLSCVAPMGDLTRAHAYKAAKDRGEEGLMNLGTFAYPVLMAADILLYDSDVVPVGRDQLQHIEMAREIAGRFNTRYLGAQRRLKDRKSPLPLFARAQKIKGEDEVVILKEPTESVQEEVATVPGADGRKMSKSYNNTIEPLAPPKELKKQVMAIVTDSKGLEEPKDPATCNIFALYKLFATKAEQEAMAGKYRAGGFGYGHAKQALLEKMEERFAKPRAEYERLLKERAYIDEVFRHGAALARPLAQQVLSRAKKACGLL